MNIDYERIEEFMNEHYKEELVNTTDTIEIDYTLLEKYYCDLANQLESKYPQIIKNLSRHINAMRIQKSNTKIRIKNATNITKISKIHQEYNNKWISFDGIVKKRSNVYNKIEKVHWRCNNCGNPYIYKLKDDENLHEPKNACRHCSRSQGYTLDKMESEYIDLQQIIIEEKQDECESLLQPCQILCYLENDMINTVNPGDNVRINGIVELKNKKNENLFTEYVKVTNIENQEEKFEEMKIEEEDIKRIRQLAGEDDIYQKITESIMPSLYGYNQLKLALALHLFSSPNHYTQDGMYKRGDIHILIIGDPSVGKSQILKYVSKLSPRGIYTSGKSASGSGLTATVVKDDISGWSLEAGAMVLANNGNICIDEFDKMKEEDRSAIHEALEQQTVSLSKAGINTTLNTKCSVLAAANPKYGRFNKYKVLGEQLNLSPPILSRFDLIFIITDDVNRQKDEMIAMKILEEDSENTETTIEYDLLKKYISYARNINPKASRDVNEYIADFFSKWRVMAKENNNPIPITARQLEAIARLSKASARIRLSENVSIEDARRAIELEKYCMKHVGFDTQSLSVEADKVMGNTSSTQRDEMMTITREFEKLCNSWGNNIPQHILMDHMHLMGFSTSKIRTWIKENLNTLIILNEMENTYSMIQ